MASRERASPPSPSTTDDACGTPPATLRRVHPKPNECSALIRELSHSPARDDLCPIKMEPRVHLCEMRATSGECAGAARLVRCAGSAARELDSAEIRRCREVEPAGASERHGSPHP